jgi:hypothetical protein
MLLSAFHDTDVALDAVTQQFPGGLRKSIPASSVFAGVPRTMLLPPAAQIAGPASLAYASRASGSLIDR